jgi:uridine kinase
LAATEVSRAALLARLADLIAVSAACRPRRVAIDGPDAAGKTTLADELAAELRARGNDVIRASIDGFHHPRKHRYRRGRLSARGCLDDSFDLDKLRTALLEPLGPGGDRRYRSAVFDFRRDRTVLRPAKVARERVVLLVDGVFLLRRELRTARDVKIFVSVEPTETLRRALMRDVGLLGSHTEVERAYRERYLPGQRLYLSEHRPLGAADVVVFNDEPDRPVLQEQTRR